MSLDTNMAVLEENVEPRAFKVPSASWQSKVYHLKEEVEQEPEWRAIAKVVKARDKHTCKSCRIKVGLTVHHIIPREEGGKDYPPNLITLCENCHNEIEELDIRDKWQIIDYRYSRKYIKKDKHIVTKETPLCWQQWVYGGYKKSQQN